MAGVASVFLDHVDQDAPEARRSPAVEVVTLGPIEPSVGNGCGDEHARLFDRGTPVLPRLVGVGVGGPLPVTFPAVVITGGRWCVVVQLPGERVRFAPGEVPEQASDRHRRGPDGGGHRCGVEVGALPCQGASHPFERSEQGLELIAGQRWLGQHGGGCGEVRFVGHEAMVKLNPDDLLPRMAEIHDP